LWTRSSPRLFVTDRGAGEPVLLITGWTISAAVFDPVAHLYLPHVRVVAYDHRGAGRSKRWLGPVSMAMLAADAARVLDERSVEAAHVVGLSMGAAVALEMAVRMPHRVKSLVLVGGGAGGPSTATPGLERAAMTVGAVAHDSIRHRGMWPAAALFSARFREQQPERVEAAMPFFARHRASARMSAMQALAAACFARRGSLGGIGAPTLVLHGGEDAMSPPENARRLADGIPGAVLHIVRGAGHAVPIEHPRASARLIVDWVDRHAGRVPAEPSATDLLVERLTRPLSLHTGAVRNTRDGVAQLVQLGRLARFPRSG
jgi:pimeloyl-ACP methyl ester carboxylesterase